MSQGRRPLTRELYDALVIAFRESPGNASFAARRALCDRRLAKRLWDGPPYDDYPWAKRIRDVLDNERLDSMARARDLQQRTAEADQAQREKARAEEVEAAAQERQLLRVARGDVLGALILAAGLHPAMQTLAKVIGEACKVAPDGSLPAISPREAMGLIDRHTRVIARAIGAAEAVIQLSRLDRGESTANVAVSGGVELTLEDALSELEALDESVRAGRDHVERTREGAPAPASPRTRH